MDSKLLLAFGLSLCIACQGHDATEHAAVDTPEAPTEEVASNEAPPELVPNARQPLDGVVSGGQPSPEQLRAAAEAGYRTVINLRTPGEKGQEGEEELVAELGMTYVKLPIAGADGITEDKARALSEALGAAEKPALLHCGSGNRVGALLALSAYHVEGMSADAAIEYGLKSGMTRLEGTVRERLSAPSDTP